MRILSGVQPSGDLHIGNYLGSVQQWVNMLDSNPEAEAVFFVVDLHAITVKQDPVVLRKKIYELLAVYLAAGIDPEKHIIFVQSQNPDHATLSWIFNCITPIGWLERMTQFKDKKQKQEGYDSIVSTGLFTYPTLMAADILLYNPDYVPVGLDQKQHVELTIDIATRFNVQYGETFRVPKFKTNEVTTKIYDLQEPTKKMSKSDKNDKGRIGLLEDPDSIRKKIMRAVTDTGNNVAFDVEKKPGISNLLSILAGVNNEPIKEVVQAHRGDSYAEFKEAVAEAVIEYLTPIQARIKELLQDQNELDKILARGAERAMAVSTPMLREVTAKMGLYQ